MDDVDNEFFGKGGEQADNDYYGGDMKITNEE